MSRDEEHISERLARFIADEREVDWDALQEQCPGAENVVENLRKLSDLASSFRRFATDESLAQPKRPIDVTGDSPSHWGPFEIVERLGEGSFGSVYRAHDPVLERDVALKIWKSGNAPTPDWTRERQRLLDEARRLAKIRHRNVVSVYGADIHENEAGMWMECLEGDSLSRTLDQGPSQLPLAESVRIAGQVVDALEAIHENGLVHGDVKDANIFLEPEGRVVLLDFGSARDRLSNFDFDPVSLTPLYAAPEVLDGETPSIRSDLYSVGVLLFRLSRGRLPFEGEGLHQLRQSHQGGRSVLAESAWEDDVPDLLSGLIKSALDQDPTQRPETARQFARTLQLVGDILEYPDTARDNLPRSQTRFFGRTREIESIRTALVTQRWITLTGPGGSGKTRLAEETASRVLGDFPGGVWWVELAPMVTGDQILPAIFEALQATGVKSVDIPTLAKRLQGKRTLIILDNAEHLPEATRSIVDPLLGGVADLHVLVTSRRSIGSPAEFVNRIEPLPIPGPDSENIDDATVSLGVDRSRDDEEARLLFEDRLRHRDPDYDIGSSKDAIVEICRRLDGIPLSIEIAAAHAATFSIPFVLERLGRILEIESPSSAVDIHSSLNASIAWSYSLLDVDARRLFRALSVFRGGWTTAAAEALFTTGTTVVGSLATLVDHSLVQRQRRNGAGVRFSMLETVREFAFAQLCAESEDSATRDNHSRYYIDYFTSRSPDLYLPEQAEVAKTLGLDDSNLQEALRVASEKAATSTEALEDYLSAVLEQERYWTLSGRKHQAAKTLARIVEKFGSKLAPQTLARTQLALGGLSHATQGSESRKVLLEAFTLFSELKDEFGCARTLLALVASDALDLKFDDAGKRLEEAKRIFEAQQDTRNIIACRIALGNNLYRQNRLEDAEEVLRDALPKARDEGSPHELVFALIPAGSVAWGRGRLDEAIRIFEDALEIARQFPRSSLLAVVHSNLGNVYAHQGNETLATTHWRLGEHVGLRAGQDLVAAMCQVGMTRYRDYAGRRDLYTSSLRIFLREHDMLFVLAILRAVAKELIEPDPEAGLDGHPQAGASLLGFEKQYRSDSSAPMIDQQVKDFEQIRAAAVARLTREEFDSAWEVGSSLDLDSAVQLATDSLPQPL